MNNDRTILLQRKRVNTLFPEPAHLEQASLVRILLQHQHAVPCPEYELKKQHYIYKTRHALAVMCKVFKTHVTAGFSSTWEDLKPERVCATGVWGRGWGSRTHRQRSIIIDNAVRNHVCNWGNVL